MSRAPAPPPGPSRIVIFGALAVLLLGGAYVLLRGDERGGPEARAPSPVEATSSAPGSEPAVRASGEPDAAVFTASEDGVLTIPAAALAGGQPVQVALALSPDEVGDQPLSATLRSAGVTHELGDARFDAASGSARIAIEAARLPPGEHLLAIRVAGDSWNPHRRVMITVTGD